VFYTSLIIIDLDFFGKGMARKRNISWLNGMWYADPKIGGLGVHDLEVQNSALGKWLLSFLLKTVSSKPSLNKSTLAQKHYPKYFGNLEIRISRPA
jgi:hypothetical protein